MSDEAELAVAFGAGVAVDTGAAVDAGATNEVAAVAAIAAVGTVGLAIGVSVGACGNNVPYSPSKHIQRRNSFFIVCLIIGCSERPFWIQRFWAFGSN
jgi:hypothetical protein